MRASLHAIALLVLLGATAFAQELPDNALLVGQWDLDEGTVDVAGQTLTVTVPARDFRLIHLSRQAP